MRRATLVAEGERVLLYQDGIGVSSTFLPAAEEACRKLEALTGRKFDAATLGPKIRIYVTAAAAVSHVWRGPEHPREPRGIIFLNRRAYDGAMNGGNATYAHELVHLLTWRYWSHTLREGIADYLALALHPGAAVGPSPAGYDPAERIASEVAEYLGTIRSPPGNVITHPAFRRAYYHSSYRFVKFLVELRGFETFMKLYEAEDPEREYADLYGASREELLRLAAQR